MGTFLKYPDPPQTFNLMNPGDTIIMVILIMAICFLAFYDDRR